MDVDMIDAETIASYPKSRSSLNSDVLSIVFTFLEPRHSLSLATTSKAVYEIALRQGLSTVLLNVRRPSQICAFSSFMLSKPSDRIPLLQNLELLGSNHYALNDTSFIAALADLLEKANYLKHLYIAHSSVLFEQELRLREAICSLTNLQELGLGSITMPELASVVEKLQSSPRKLSLDDLLGDPTSARLEEETVDFTFLSTLQHLEYLDVSSCMRFGYRLSSECRNVHHISLALPVVPIPVLARAFPNLRSLCICPHYGGRRHSQVDQGIGDNLAQWHHLDRLHGAALALADWRSSCHVRWLKLDYEIISAEHDQVAALKSLQSSSPLFFSFATAAYVGVKFWSRMVQVVPRLRCLELILDLGLPDFEIKMRSWLVSKTLQGKTHGELIWAWMFVAGCAPRHQVPASLLHSAGDHHARDDRRCF